jgi:arylsulfatase A-like enzyme
LLGLGTPRDTVFCCFPHYAPATGGVPAAWVRRGDWKLIRFFCDGPEQTDRFELYNLKSDIGETRNVAAEYPDVVKECDALISEHLKDINATIPVKNPAYDSTAKASEPGKKPHKDKAAIDTKTSGGKDGRQHIEKASDAS